MKNYGCRWTIKLMGVVLAISLGTSVVKAEVLLSYDFESVAPTDLFVVTSGGGVVSNTTVTALGASNKVYLTTSDSSPWGSWTGIGQASGVVAGLNSTSGYAIFEAKEKASNSSTVVATLNALTPGTYYLRISYDESRMESGGFRVGVVISGNNGGIDQGARGAPGTPGTFVGFDRWGYGVRCLDPLFDNAFIKCAGEHEHNNKTSKPYPWRIKIVPAGATPTDLNVFKQGSFTELDIFVHRDQTGETYIDNLLIEYQKVDGNKPVYLDDLLRTAIISSDYSTAYVDYPGTTAPGDGMIEYLRYINNTDAPYTRAGDVTIDVAAYSLASGGVYKFGSGAFGYRDPAWRRFYPLWIKGDGQVSPTNTVATWTLRDQGLASHGFGCWNNQLITFDLAAIRSYLLDGTANPMQLVGQFGMLGENSSATANVIGGVWVDGVNVFISATKTRDDASDAFDLRLNPADRYLTLAVLDAKDWLYSFGVFKDVSLTVVLTGTVITVR